MIHLPRSRKRFPPSGAWVPVLLDGKPTARITCPECSECYLLDHEVAANGTVIPSVDCPTKKCTWHVHVVLDGWTP